MNDSAASFDDKENEEFDTNIKELGLLNFLKSEKGKKYLKYRFFREPYWLGYMSILSVTFYAAIAIGLSFTPISFLAMPIIAYLFYTQIKQIYTFQRTLTFFFRIQLDLKPLGQISFTQQLQRADIIFL